MKKSLALLLALALCAAFLSSCHGKLSGTNAVDDSDYAPFVMPDSFDTTRDYEITFWAKNDTNKRQTDIYKKAIQDFEALYPNITVKLKLYTDYTKIYSDVITNISVHSTPDVCITYPDHIATYLTSTNLVVPLDDLMTNADYGLGGSNVEFDSPTKDEIVTEFLQECYLDGTCYALPYMRSTEACYVNKTYVEKLGFTLPETLTWDFIWEVSVKATQKDGNGNYLVNGQQVMLPFIYKSTDNMMIQMLKQLGADYSTSDGKVLIFNDTTRELLLEIADYTKQGAFSTFKYSGYPGNFLNAGQCIFAIDSTAGATWMGSDAPLLDIPEDSITEFETVVMSIPQYDVDNPKMISQGPSICLFNSDDPQQVMASWLFMQYLLTNEVQIAYAETEGYVPVTSKAQSSEEYVDYLSRAGEDNDNYYGVKIAASKLLLDNIANTFVTPVYNGSASLRNASGALIENVVKSIFRKETVDDAFITKQYNSIRSQYKLTQNLDLGAWPTESIVLIVTLAVVWGVLGTVTAVKKVKHKKAKSS